MNQQAFIEKLKGMKRSPKTAFKVAAKKYVFDTFDA